jgi:hypothetical protein
LTKPTGVLEHCREAETSPWFYTFRGISFWPHPQGDRKRQYTVLIHSGAIPLNYTSKFQECFEATTLMHRNTEAVAFTKPQHTFSIPVSSKLFTVIYHDMHVETIA